ncbi:DsrE family protein [Sulfurovum sp. zt1-1]|uniref:DsrE family protein n=1 Tax=Sulfurovum zhangzhouensis TaxID=3019067 RepID=A0ABT7R0V6_9BACT|nr:DsrE family protein [Sulfurovum zhangzhouensis]MDM5272726.1 DsrE family protein [Sulfurovum zhangzhouensis]
MKHLLRSFLLLLVFPFLLLGAEENAVEKKIVYDLKSGDISVIETNLISAIANNSIYYENHFEELKVKVVIHGDSYKFFVQNSDDLKMKEIGKRLKALYDNYDVTFEMCSVGMKKRNISEKSLYPFVKVVPNSTIALIDAQNDGYAYLPLH